MKVNIKQDELQNIIKECFTELISENVTNKVDNFNVLANLISLPDPNDQFFFIQIIKRWKDNKDKGMIKDVGNTYHAGAEYGNVANGTAFKVHNPQELLSLKQQIIKYCDANNARAYLCCNPRSQSAIDAFKPTYLARLKKQNHGQLPQYAAYADDILSAQAKEDQQWTDRPRFFFDVDCIHNTWLIPNVTIHIDRRSNRVDDVKYPQLRACEAELSSRTGVVLLHPKYPNQKTFIQSLGGINVWDGSKQILADNNVPIEMEYETPSGGLHIVVADRFSISNLRKVIHDLRIFDGYQDLGKNQTVHANIDGKLILYSNVDTAGY